MRRPGTGWLIFFDYDESIYCLEKALEINPKMQVARMYLAGVNKNKLYNPDLGGNAVIYHGWKLYISNAFFVYVEKLFRIHLMIEFVVMGTISVRTDDSFAYTAGLMYLIISGLFVLFCRSPLNQIEVDYNYLIGPARIGNQWRQYKVPIENINVRKSDQQMNTEAYYRIYTMDGVEIRALGFNYKQYDKLLAFIRHVKAHGQVKDPLQ